MDEIRADLTHLLNFIPNNFPGAQPVSLDWSNAHLLHDKKYLVTEKSDGERKMLYSYNGTTHLIDRSFNGIKSTILITKEKTILDGEIVLDTLPDGTQIERYLVFDAIVCKDIDIKELPLLYRLSRFYSCVLEPARSTDSCGEIYMKDFFELKDIHTVMNLKLLHPSDGFIFTPTEDPYCGGRCKNILKYKEAKETTVDFAAWKSNYSIELYCGVRGDDIKWIGYADECDKNYLHFYTSLIGKTIVECDWVEDRQRWRIRKIRKDKIKSNDIKVLNWNIYTIQHSLSPVDLQNLILKKEIKTESTSHEF